MAKIRSWQEADEALRTMGLAEIAKTKVEARMNEAIDRAKKSAVEDSQPHLAAIAALESELRAFFEANRGKSRSRTLTFGALALRAGARVVELTQPEKTVIWRLATGLRKYLRETFAINRQALLDAPNEDHKALEKCGVTFGLGADRFRALPDLAAIVAAPKKTAA